ncbi:hypothetical protein KIH39_18020 [Telmatocola sphagniphila]|uniref:Uncharacterized protein n=1 Tax=Telmatocola sphagniphila TaxID=1123043 RepID=A0A8E6B5F0_9BACT|nr:hypothetical protein [Telmatocola sphagniphila]QVL30740.1 hypothetical protein KIH39_18020 [Telmatocola sphagniphila]
MNRDSVLAWLSSMTDKQFVDFFYEAASNRDTSEIDGERGHFVLANTSKVPGEERDTVFLAMPNPINDSDGWSKDCPICQTGQCTECGSLVRSIAKHAICPVCEAKVYCT